jgi:hypothetical protein
MIADMARHEPEWVEFAKADAWFWFCSLVFSALLWVAYSAIFAIGDDLQMPGFAILISSFLFAARRLTLPEGRAPPSYLDDFGTLFRSAVGLLPICFDTEYFKSVTANQFLWLTHSSVVLAGSYIARRIISAHRSLTYQFLGFPSLTLSLLILSWSQGDQKNLVMVFILVILLDLAYVFASSQPVPDSPNKGAIIWIALSIVVLFSGGLVAVYHGFNAVVARERLETLRSDIWEVVRGGHLDRLIILGAALFAIDFSRSEAGWRLPVLTIIAYTSLLLYRCRGDSRESVQGQARALVYLAEMVVFSGQTNKSWIAAGLVAAFLFVQRTSGHLTVS